eukprot:649485-Prymnesium_polylepis.1
MTVACTIRRGVNRPSANPLSSVLHCTVLYATAESGTCTGVGWGENRKSKRDTDDLGRMCGAMQVAVFGVKMKSAKP